MTDDLVERVALAIADAYYRSASSGQLTLQDTDTIPEDWEAEARAAIAVLLEEAAKVADGWVGCSEWSADTNSGYECASREIAAAIRAMIRKEKE